MTSLLKNNITIHVFIGTVHAAASLVDMYMLCNHKPVELIAFCKVAKYNLDDQEQTIGKC